MNDVLAVVRVEHPDLALTRTVAHDGSAVVQPIREAGTDPEHDSHFFSVRSADFERFEAGLRADHTVARFERVMQVDDEAVYKFGYTEQAKLFSPELTRANGVALRIENVDTGWIMQVWVPERRSLRYLWEYAEANDIRIELERINDYSSLLESFGLTATQREAILLALEAGYFEEPREASLSDVARRLDISQPAAGGLLRRGLKRLVLSTLAESDLADGDGR
jgi:predicted DNA binding protein